MFYRGSRSLWCLTSNRVDLYWRSTSNRGFTVLLSKITVSLKGNSYQTLKFNVKMTTSIYSIDMLIIFQTLQFGCHLQSSIFDACSNFPKNYYVESHFLLLSFCHKNLRAQNVLIRIKKKWGLGNFYGYLKCHSLPNPILGIVKYFGLSIFYTP